MSTERRKAVRKERKGDSGFRRRGISKRSEKEGKEETETRWMDGRVVIFSQTSD